MKTQYKDYYALLGVDPGATLEQIKKAYRTLAKQYHPDVNDSSDAADRFREITEAYDTLTDPDRRRRYNRLHATFTGGKTSGNGGRWSGFTRPGNGTHAGNGSASSNGSQTASRLLKVLEDIWLEIAAGTRKSPRPSSSSPAEPNGNRPGSVTTPPAGGTSSASNTPRS